MKRFMAPCRRLGGLCCRCVSFLSERCPPPGSRWNPGGGSGKLGQPVGLSAPAKGSPGTATNLATRGSAANAGQATPSSRVKTLPARAWDPAYLGSLRGSTRGDRITFELIQGEFASGTIGQLQQAGDEIIYVAGTLEQPERGKFFFQKQTLGGIAGAYVGVVELPESKRAFRIEPTGPGGSPELVGRPLGDVLCLSLPMPETEAADMPPLKPTDFPMCPRFPRIERGILVLESLPGATPVLYLDFQGGYTPTWGGSLMIAPA